MRQRWDDFGTRILVNLGTDDDERLWRAAIDVLFRDAEFLCHHARPKSPIYTQLGCCSHWLSPHNSGSWLPDARFAWPSGYGGGTHSIFGLPEFDWSLIWRWDRGTNRWTRNDRIRSKRPLAFRVTLPARTARRTRAVVHALWLPGSPTVPNVKLLQAYGFVKQDAEWHCTSTYGKDDAYEVD